jgi:hypothetical protein
MSGFAAAFNRIGGFSATTSRRGDSIRSTRRGVGPLIAANPHPERICYFKFGLGHEDGKRPFYFLPAAANDVDEPDEKWVTATIHRLDSLVADGTLGPIDFMKLDAETYEAEIVRGAREFFASSGILGVESEASFVRTSRNPRSVFVELYEEARPLRFQCMGCRRATRFAGYAC